jgi:hypothetical protein
MERERSTRRVLRRSDIDQHHRADGGTRASSARARRRWNHDDLIDDRRLRPPHGNRNTSGLRFESMFGISTIPSKPE